MSFQINDTENLQQALDKISNCTRELKIWMTHNCLKLNDDKTEVLVITRVRDSDKVNVQSVRIGDTAVQVAKTAKNIHL